VVSCWMTSAPWRGIPNGQQQGHQKGSYRCLPASENPKKKKKKKSICLPVHVYVRSCEVCCFQQRARERGYNERPF
jgi:hypothetical protein